MPTIRRDCNCEMRAEKGEDGKLKLRGLAVVYNRKSVNLGGFNEIIKPGAFDKLLKRNDLDVVALFNHDANNVLARTPKTLQMKDTKDGLFVEIDLPDTDLGRSVHQAVERGDIKGQSFSFAGVEDEWNNDFTERTITSIGNLFDVGPVTFPAYPDTTVAARCKQEAIEKRSLSVIQTQNINRSSAMDPKQMRDQAQQLSKSAEAISGKAIAEKRDLTPEEVKNISDLNAKAANLLKGAKALEESAAIRSQLAAVAAPVAAPAAPVESRNLTLRPQVTMPLRFDLRSFKPDQFGTHAAANESAYRSGMFILASL